jgi:pimeloyl-ACP methyl ester carboxylesterase
MKSTGACEEEIFLIKVIFAGMKTFKRLIGALLFLSAIISVVSSCNKSKEPEYDHFVNKEYIDTYTTSYINTLLDIASAAYPELSDLKPLISHPVDIYRVIYKTQLNGKVINASGLACVPSAQGNYPILSFQNGTNTMNDYAPSEYPGNPSYQFIEVIASMGFIVIIPDYPGFGESADIPHPYLIKEPTVRSLVDFLFAVKEMDTEELPDVTIKDAVYLAGYSQGGWATLALQEALENDYQGEFTLKGSVCGAGPYDLNLLFRSMTTASSYPMPVYIGYIINAYSRYDQFTNPVSDILKEPYASRLGNLYTGSLTSDQINKQLTTSIPDLFTNGFLSGFLSEAKYASVRASLASNSIAGWNTAVPLLLIHGGGDTSVDPLTTESIYLAMIQAGTSPQTCTKEIIPDLDHGDAAIPAMIKGLQFIMNLEKEQK